MSDQSTLRQQAEKLVDLVVARLPETLVIDPEQCAWDQVGLALMPFDWVLFEVALAPARPEHVVVSLEAFPLYCPGNFYLVHPLGKRRGLRRAFADIGLPKIRLLPSFSERAVDAVADAVHRELPDFRASCSPDGLLAMNRYDYEDDLDSQELVAYSFLLLGDLARGKAELERLATAASRTVTEPQEAEAMEAVRRHAGEMSVVVGAGQAAVMDRLAEIRSERLASMGIGGHEDGTTAVDGR